MMSSVFEEKHLGGKLVLKVLRVKMQMQMQISFRILVILFASLLNILTFFYASLGIKVP